jgi:cobalt-zinc-cadmium efflux system membrane fusion protein
MRIEATPVLLDQIETGVVGWADIGSTMTVAAHVEVDENRVTRVGSPLMGRTQSIEVREGEDVQQGQLLALLNSPGLSDGQLQFLKAMSHRQVSLRAVERAKVLLNAAVIGSAELQRREAELDEANAEMAAAADQLSLLGMPEEAIKKLEQTRTLNSVARVVATMDGTVLARKATLGQMVQATDTMFEVADLSGVWMVADVPEEVAGSLVRGQTVEAEVAALPNRKFRGVLSFVGSTVDPATRTIRVRMEVPNPDRKLKPEMLATVVLRGPAERKAVVPAAAVVREDNLEHLFVQVDDGTFVLRPVTLGAEQNGTRVLIDGVRANERIVLEGAFHLNNERRRQALRGSEGA